MSHSPAIRRLQMEVDLRPDSLAVVIRMRPILRGALFARVKVEESTWFLEGRVLTLVLLKASRRGCFRDGTTNADTFWKSVLKSPQEGERLEVGHTSHLALGNLARHPCAVSDWGGEGGG